MKSSDIKVGGEYAHARFNYDWDEVRESSIRKVKIIEAMEWTEGPSWNRKRRKGFKVEGLPHQTKVTPRELRATWSDYLERLKRVEEMRRSADEAQFNEWVVTYAALAQIERAIRKIDVTREPVEFEFRDEREMLAARAAGLEVRAILVDGVSKGVTYVAMDYERDFGRPWLRPKFQISQRDAGLLALRVLLED